MSAGPLASLAESVPGPQTLKITHLQSDTYVANLTSCSTNMPAHLFFTNVRHSKPSLQITTFSLFDRSYSILKTTNEQLDQFNEHSALAYAAVSTRLGKHARTLSTVHTDLMHVFKRVRAIKRKLLEQHPELRAASDALDAARDAAAEKATVRLYTNDCG